jgi:tetratricopeptide (TPR) repeat protein
MSLRLPCALIALSVVLCVRVVSDARPPDLPLDRKDVCVPATPTPGTPGTPGMPAPAAGIDARRQGEAGRLFRVGERCLRDGDFLMAINCFEETVLLCPRSSFARLATSRLRQLQRDPPSTTESIKETDADLERLADAKLMYEIGQRCELGDDLDSARRCYEEAHRICPASRWGKQALERVLALDKHSTQEPPVVGEQEARRLGAPDAARPSSVPVNVEEIAGSIAVWLGWPRHNDDEARRTLVIGEWWLRLGRLEEAAHYFEAARALSPDSEVASNAVQRMDFIKQQRSLRRSGW